MTAGWIKLDLEDQSTHPDPGQKVLALIVWSKGDSHQFGSIADRSTMREAEFYMPVYGFYCRKRDLVNCPDDADDADDTVFAHDHGGEDYENPDDWCDPPLWWCEIDTPQQQDLDIAPKGGAS